MQVNEYGEIISATQGELYKKYIEEEYYKDMSFKTFLETIERQGTTIVY
jgi:hypothetical protein